MTAKQKSKGNILGGRFGSLYAAMHFDHVVNDEAAMRSNNQPDPSRAHSRSRAMTGTIVGTLTISVRH